MPLPIIIAGNGPIGMRAAKQRVEKFHNTALVIYLEEQQEP
jgi:hypothetical protein